MATSDSLLWYVVYWRVRAALKYKCHEMRKCQRPIAMRKFQRPIGIAQKCPGCVAQASPNILSPRSRLFPLHSRKQYGLGSIRVNFVVNPNCLSASKVVLKIRVLEFARVFVRMHNFDAILGCITISTQYLDHSTPCIWCAVQLPGIWAAIDGYICDHRGLEAKLWLYLEDLVHSSLSSKKIMRE